MNPKRVVIYDKNFKINPVREHWIFKEEIFDKEILK